MYSKILITGGCGFIGSHFINYISEKYPELQIINLDKMTYAADRSFHNRNKCCHYKHVYGDIISANLVYTLMKNCDAVINFAAETHVDRSIDDASDFISTNINGTFNLLEQARKISGIRYIQISTDEVYGSLPINRPDLKFTEDNPLNPKAHMQPVKHQLI